MSHANMVYLLVFMCGSRSNSQQNEGGLTLLKK